MNILQISVIHVVSQVLEMINSMGSMVVASMYPINRIVVKPINCEYTGILDNMMLCCLTSGHTTTESIHFVFCDI